jgi:hypothetical protein
MMMAAPASGTAHSHQNLIRKGGFVLGRTGGRLGACLRTCRRGS